ncbi:unnamed protein product [Klebsiella pneumoniae]|nr:unnamed protein product [Klebsiella pneumoniae]
MAAVALPGLQGPLTGSNLAGPRKRSAAGQDIRHGTCNFAGWRLSPGPAYRVLSQAHTSQARASAAPPGKIQGTVPVISPGGGYALPGLQGPLTGSYLAGPRKRSAAGHEEIYFPASGWVSNAAITAASAASLKPCLGSSTPRPKRVCSPSYSAETSAKSIFSTTWLFSQWVKWKLVRVILPPSGR